MRLLFSVLITCFFLMGPVLGHQPTIVGENLTIVNNPEVSQAFYGELKGSPAYYQISSDKNFELYVQLTIPDVPNIGKDVSARITNVGDPNFAVALDGTNYNWTSFYEEFGGDYYFQGPDFKQEVGPGTYLIEVYRPDNQGKYVFVVGEKEEFPFDVTIRTLLLLPTLKQDFFQKPAYEVLFSRMGILYWLVIIGIVVVGLVVWFIKKK